MKAMTLLADDSASPIFLALTGAAVSKTAKDELNLRYGTNYPKLQLQKLWTTFELRAMYLRNAAHTSMKAAD